MDRTVVCNFMEWSRLGLASARPLCSWWWRIAAGFTGTFHSAAGWTWVPRNTCAGRCQCSCMSWASFRHRPLSGPLSGFEYLSDSHYSAPIVRSLTCTCLSALSAMWCGFVATPSSSSPSGSITPGITAIGFEVRSFISPQIFILRGLIFGSGIRSVLWWIISAIITFLVSLMSASRRKLLHPRMLRVLTSVPQVTRLLISVSFTA